MDKRIINHLIDLYGKEAGTAAAKKIESILEPLKKKNAKQTKTFLTESSAWLITYGDMVTGEGYTKLQALYEFLRDKLPGIVDSVHILPFYPYSSDDGFSVIDYKEVDPKLGTWDGIRRFADHFNLTADAVFNHISSQSEWFQECLKGNPEYRDFFIRVPKDADTSSVTRPRSLPLLTAYSSPDGGEDDYYWTTFSDDQIDLNFACPDLLVRLIEILFFYVEEGITTIRLDAVAFFWKELGTSCMHLRQTHKIVKICRLLLDEYARHVLLLTETNVPHAENISYFGKGNEANMVYQFPLPPLTAHAVMAECSIWLNQWAESLEDPEGSNTYFNFLASHDGIGLRPAMDILPDQELNYMLQTACNNGGLISYRDMPDGSQSPYELNISYFNLFWDGTEETYTTALRKFILAHSILMCMPGVPAVYFHSMFGSVNYTEGVEKTGRNRTINREKLNLKQLQSEVRDRNSRRYIIYAAMAQMLRIRATEPAFHPKSGFEILNLSPDVFIIKRNTGKGETPLTAIHNLSSGPQALELEGDFVDIITGTNYYDEVELPPHEFLWLKG